MPRSQFQTYSVIFNSFGFQDIASCIYAQGVTGPIAVIPLHNGCTNQVELIPTGVGTTPIPGPSFVADPLLIAGGVAQQQINYPPPPPNPPMYGRFYVITPDNAEHPLGLASDGTYRSIDGSSFMFVPSSTPSVSNANLGTWEDYYSGDTNRVMGPAQGTITDSRGNVYTTSSITDVNGNQIAISNGSAFYGLPATDSTGRSIPLPTQASTSSCPVISQAQNQPLSSAGNWAPPGSGNGFLFCSVTVNLNSASTFPLVRTGYDGGRPYSKSVSMLQSIVLPNGQFWAFVYDSYSGSGYTTGTGNLMTLILPTGGTISYVYAGNGGGACNPQRESGLVPAAIFDYPPSISSRTITDPTTGWSAETTYGYPTPGPGGTITGSILSPTGDLTVTKWTDDGSGSGCGLVSAGQDVYKGNPSPPSSATPLKSTSITYNASTAAGPPFVSSQRVNVETTTWNGTNTSSVQHGYAPSVGLAALSCDSTGNNCGNGGGTATAIGQESTKTYIDFSGSELKKDVTTYQWQANSAYFTANLLDIPASVQTVDASNNQWALTSYTYDESSYSSGGTRGLPTTTTQWLNLGTSPTTHTGWTSFGEKSYFIDAKGNENSNGHTADYNYQNTAAGCYDSVVTSTVNALNQTISGGYDCNTGLLTTYYDLNSQKTTLTYDGMRRLVCVEYPDGGSTAFNINDAARTVDKVTRLNGSDACQSSSSNMDMQYAFDGLGRQIHTRLLSDPSGTTYTDTTYDNMGRVGSVTNPYRSTSDQTYGVTQYAYDALSRKIKETEPDSSLLYWCYDSNGSYGQPNCHSILGSGAGEWVDSSDEASNDWQHVSDALGRLTRVYEPNGSSSTPSMETDYTYDNLNDLVSVKQCGASCSSPAPNGPINRSFTYNSLAQLVTGNNPETGADSYTYDLNGNLISKVSPAVNAPAGSTTTQTLGYCYDALNRLVGKWSLAPPLGCNTTPTSVTSTLLSTYTYGLASNPTYNTGGRLIDKKAYLLSTLVAEDSPTKYDPMGRLQSEWQCPYSPACSSAEFVFNYTYDPAGDVTSSNNGLSAPATPLTFSFTYDGAQRLSDATTTQPSSWSTTTYPITLLQANSTNPAAYDPWGHLVSAQIGLNPTTHTTATDIVRQYDNRGRIISEADGSLYSFTVPTGTNPGYDAVGNLKSYSDSAVMGTWNFNYDTLNRLVTAQNTAVTSVSGEYAGVYGCWNYDGFGNRTKEEFFNGSHTSCTGNVVQLTVTTPTANNQVTGYTYDAAGNVLYDGQNHYLYDSEGRICAFAYPIAGGGWGYSQTLYDAEGRRVGQGGIPSLPSSCNAPSSANNFASNNQILLALDGQWVTQLNGSGSPNYSNAFAGGKLLGTYVFTGNQGLHFALSDPLGTKRVQFTVGSSGQAEAELNCLSLPFGNDIGNPLVPNCQQVGVGGSDDDGMHFTGKQRGNATGLDYFGARYYASSMGRFLSPDPTLRSGHPADPQTWNRYVYGGNNPLKFIDPDGKEKQLVIYVQQPVPGTRTVSTMAGTNYGHAFIGLKDTVSGVEHRIGFYPKSKWDLVGDRSASVAGTLKNDDKSDWTVKKTFTVSDDKFKSLVDDVNKQLADPEQYNMQTNNCATWVVNEAGVAGVDLPQTPGKQDGGSGLDPGDLGQDLRERGTGAVVNPDHDPVGSGSLAPDPPPPPTPKPPPPPPQQQQ